MQQPIQVPEKEKFTEHLTIDHKGKPQMVQMEFDIERKRQKTELQLHQEAALKGVHMKVDVPHEVDTKLLRLKQQVEAQVTQRQELDMSLIKEQRRFSETISIDHTPKPKEVQFDFTAHIPKTESSVVSMQQDAALRGMKMAVEYEQRKQTSRIDVATTQRAEAIETQREEIEFMLEGAPPMFTKQLAPKKVMDGEEVKFHCMVSGNPMPEVTWYKDDRVVEDNPDFRTLYNKKTGECLLLILEVFPQDTAEYRCVAVNNYGTATTRGRLDVECKSTLPIYNLKTSNDYLNKNILCSFYYIM